jgi:Cys-tRNA(Pro)/Cys-tRNA(Cys) deacylase
LKQKTNAARILDSLGISYAIRTFPISDEHIDAVTVAKQLEVEAERVFKTIVCTDTATSFFVFVIPAPSELDLRKAANAAGAKRIRLLSIRELTKVTGYVRGGCSPIGMKKLFPTYIEESAQMYDSVLVSAGIRGAQLVIVPADLIRSVPAVYADIV